ncbi:MAG: alanine racemase [Alphaproteobacteria bacterium]|nr:alanine racemase [Alphaproteobacteria bacterium]
MTHSIVGTLTVDLAAVAANYRALSTRVGQAQTAAAVKADAYGLGMAQVAPALAAAGCDYFYVAHLEEALILRKLLPNVTIAVLHGIASADQSLANQERLLPVLCDIASIRAWHEHAQVLGQTLPVTIHLDTGMNRLGLPADERALLAESPALLAGLEVRFWLSHLACADEPQHNLNTRQLSAFRNALASLPKAPVSFVNSSGIFLGADYHFDQARPGCALYGINPTPEQPNPMLPVTSLTAPIIQLRPLLSNATVGYGASWRSKRQGLLAVLPVGYADGFSRALSSKGTVYFGDYAAPIVGRVSMDLITVDVTEVPEHLCQPGMVAELFGKHQEVDAVATAANTIGYEILTNLGRRYRRIYKDAA